ncbi:MAG TPA: hypothetical protein VHV30_12785 [Polyangiaceae bacterium]|nr:hypothetical protein [Polyangiaceae bacterium]
MRSTVVAAAILASFTTGCSSSYMPVQGPRLSVVMESGTPVYMRDGQRFSGGFLGGDIEDAVRGSPRAEDYAHDYKSGMVTGFVSTLAGALAIGVGAGLAGGEASQSSTPTPGLVTLGGGALLYIVGLGMLLAAQPHLYDAINAYNDDFDHAGGPVRRALSAPPPPPADEAPSYAP